MVRSLTVAATALALALAFAPASALACDGEPECPMKKSAKADEVKKADKTMVKTNAKADVKATDKKLVAPAEAAPVVKPTEQSSIMDEIDTILAAKCSCSSASDCTCKKGECKCSKCGGHKKTQIRMIESLRGNDGTIIPVNARYDATAGVFI